MDKNTSKYFDQLKTNQVIFLNFLRAKYPLFHNSNFFFRDFHYGIKRYLEKKGNPVSYEKSEIIAKELSMYFESQGIFIRTNNLGWKINYPEFTTQVTGDPFK
jgi:hypothetical protein